MKNRLYFDIKTNAEVFEKIKNEQKDVGYYELPDVDISYLKTLDGFKQKDIVVIGIGGSSLGTKAVDTFLSYNRQKDKKLHFIDTTDPGVIVRLLKNIDMNNSLFLIISKSGTTVETISAFKYILRFKELNSKDFIFITDLNSNLHKLGIKHNIETFEIPHNVGGRFSVLSNVGLVPLYLMGYDVKRFLKGAKKIKEEFFNEENIKEIILKKATFYTKNFLNFNINTLFSYSRAFIDFNAWYMQLWAESLGKKQLNSQLNIGLTPIGLIGPTDQHSFLQLIVDGPRDKTVTFLEIKDFGIEAKIPDKSLDFLEKLDLVNNIEFETLINMQAEAIVENLKNKEIPLDVIEIDGTDIYDMGQLIYYFELLTSVTGKMMGIDAYDQPGVEEGKKILKEKLSKDIA